MKAAMALGRMIWRDGPSAGRLPGGALVVALVLGTAIAPQAGQAQPIVQSLPAAGNQTLNAALARLGRDPRDLSALIDAGNAALAMGDVDAAVGFFARADQLSPENMRVKAGLAGALVRSDNPYDAIPLFAEAEKAGGLDPQRLSDRGLAYDLVGDTASAQRYYRQALGLAHSDDTIRRLALSQAIGGDRAGMEATLSPLLVRQDKAAWRTRAFALAILNRPEEAVAIANQTMPAELAGGIAPYLRYMPRLTPAQQAAAANFGRFPRAAEIGRDDPRVALYAPPRRVATAAAALVPAGEPLGRGKSRRDQRDERRPVTGPAQFAANPPAPAPRQNTAPPEPLPGRQSAPAPTLAVVAPPDRRPAAPPPGPAQAPLAQAPLAQAAPVARPPAASAPAAPVQSATFDLARVTASRAPAVAPPISQPAATPAQPAPVATRPTVTPAPAAAAPPAVRPARPRSLADAFADFAVPSAPAALPPGAVDVRKVSAKAAAPAKVVPPPKPAHPSRIWVQVGTGRDVKALGFTWRGLAKDNPDLFKGKSPATSDWGRTNRLLAGPFATEAAAGSFLAKLKKAEVDAFLWTSPAGQVVDDLPGT